MDCSCDRAGCIICIDIVGLVVIIHSHRAYDRKEIFFQKVKENVCIDFLYISHKSNIFSVGKLFIYFQKSAVFSADSDGTYSQLFHQLYQTLVHFTQNHFCDFHGVFIGHTQSVDELWLHSHFADPFADLFSTAMHNDRFKSNQLQQGHILNHLTLQIFIDHRASTVFYYDDLPVKSLDIRKCLDQHLCLIQILLHILVHFPLIPSCTANPAF